MDDTRVAYLPLDEVDRAVVEHQTRGFVKLIAGPRRVLGKLGGGHILGATIAAPTWRRTRRRSRVRDRRPARSPAASRRPCMPTRPGRARSQQTAAQFFFTYGGRAARPARHDR